MITSCIAGYYVTSKTAPLSHLRNNHTQHYHPTTGEHKIFCGKPELKDSGPLVCHAVSMGEQLTFRTTTQPSQCNYLPVNAV